MQKVTTALATTNFALFVEVVLIQLSFCLNYNNPPQVAATDSLYGVLLCGIIEDLDFGYQFGHAIYGTLRKG
ncbi:MAG UNVERIFIED_CONTAM: hypothetical protein LVR29_21455 [Microcystis novacekii LVE1205-3]|jgi:predicted ATPase